MSLSEIATSMIATMDHISPIVGATEVNTYEYNPAKSLSALILYGIVAWLNTITPTTLWFTYKNQGNGMSTNNVFYWAWYIFWVAHLTLWGFPSLMILFTFWELDLANRIFLFAIDIILIAPFAVYLFVFALFLIAAIDNSLYSSADTTEEWLTFSLYFILAGITSAV